MATDGKKKEVRRFTTPPFVVSFPNVFEAKKHEDGEGPAKFGLTAIWRPAKFTDADKVLWKKIIQELHTVSKRDFKKAWNELPDNVKRGLRDGAAKEGIEGYGDGTRFANMTTKSRPGVVDKDKNVISPDEGNEDLIYPGCIARATINVYSYGLKKGSKGKGVALGLFNVQVLKSNTPRLDNRVKAEDDFDEDIDGNYLDDDADDFDGDNDAGDDFG